ncbi:unnamed protein product [Caenorhabditis bovis]|uniref:Seven TM Receptor n=1 Tax=Caenorhabditis bovis TaxID=2654633 RepID=A0A8S1ECG0_9PELO|nr:unnamed protein product [Caenorhabditis bovis]
MAESWNSIRQRIQEYCAGLSLISNGYLLVLIKYKSPPQLVFYCLLWMITTHLILGPWDHFTDFIREPVAQKFEINVDDIVYVGPYYFPLDEKGNQYLNYYTLFGMMILTLITTSSMFCVFWFGQKCYRQIHELAHVVNSKKTKSLQRQLLNALVVQTLIPVVLMFIPITFLFSAPYFEQSFEFGSCCINITVAVYPAIDAFPTLFIIAKYRNVTLSFFKKVRKSFATKYSNAQLSNIADYGNQI